VAAVLVAVKKYEKLVRDRIPEIIERAGKTATWRELRDGEFHVALKAKALEEAQELFDATDDALLSELAELEEVVEAILTAYGYSRDELDAVRETKNEDRGAFTRGLFLESVSD
jgi:predicted house-cleaning noncanonical NTP pyrophosphatase (MazG superfamily)